jgi:hypothetical protein
MKDPLDFTPLTEAQIPVAHFAKLCGADRASVHYWVRGTQPRGLYRERAAKALKLLQRALDKGSLPLPTLPRPKQYDALVAALKN